MAQPDLSRARWRKASKSNGQGGACVEVALNLPDIVAVRDSKDPDGSVLVFSHREWDAFLDGASKREFDIP
ncbi:DUF397 domain-containing protein [Nonomuraea sp. NPDC049649]|uniref:DUF397 domain-containing protein n=1 Tax=Nonomuraea sp. NPDC049649 TaxID=3155776 RepID=UPI0034234124